MAKTRQTAEFGDFQTPIELAKRVCTLLLKRGVAPRTIIEPNCGKGAFLKASVEAFESASRIHGLDINPEYIEVARKRLPSTVRLRVADFFTTNWQQLLSDCPEPVLFIGNPPWVTNSALGSLQSANLPKKSNFQMHSGIEAITGKGNFDISEWMLIKLVEWFEGKNVTIAMLCKTGVARKVLAHCWKEGVLVKSSEVYLIDAIREFGAAVDACLFICDLSKGVRSYDCQVFDRLDADSPSRTFGYRDGRLLADVDAYERYKHLEGTCIYRWRSGIKHDSSKVMEFTREGGRYCNGLGESVELEPTYLYPMLKSSEVANGKRCRGRPANRWMLVTQRSVGEDTAIIQQTAPNTWQYLLNHAKRLDSRGSSIYRNRPRFSVFGVGPYSFSPWKIAISGFYKSLRFTALGSREGKPIVLDDTSYFIACKNECEAELIASLLNSQTAQDFYSAYIFWDAKRPITAAALSLLDIQALASELGKAKEFQCYCPDGEARPLFAGLDDS